MFQCHLRAQGRCLVAQKSLPTSAVIPLHWDKFPITSGSTRFRFHFFFNLRDFGCSFTKHHVNNQFLFSYVEDIHLLLRLYLFAVRTQIKLLSPFHIHILFIVFAFTYLSLVSSFVSLTDRHSPISFVLPCYSPTLTYPTPHSCSNSFPQFGFNLIVVRIQVFSMETNRPAFIFSFERLIHVMKTLT